MLFLFICILELQSSFWDTISKWSPVNYESADVSTLGADRSKASGYQSPVVAKQKSLSSTQPPKLRGKLNPAHLCGLFLVLHVP